MNKDPRLWTDLFGSVCFDGDKCSKSCAREKLENETQRESLREEADADGQSRALYMGRFVY